MGWIIFAIWMILGIMANIFLALDNNSPKESKEKKHAEIGWQVCMWIGIVLLGVGLLYGLGWLWYYFCCGFLVFEEPNFLWKIIYGLMTLIPLSVIVGLIAIAFGWNPDK